MELNNRFYLDSQANYAFVPVNHETRGLIGDNHVLVSRDGLSAIVNGKKVIFDGKTEYPRLYLSGTKHPYLHRVMAIAWLGVVPYGADKWVINHIDGDPKNNHIDNLEWASFSDNITHAYKNGLRYDNRIIITKDLETGVIIEHYSLQECARYLNVNGAMVYYYLKNKNRIRKGKYVIIEKGDDWPEFTQEEIEKAKKVVEIYPIKVTNTSTGEIKIYKNIHEACRELNMNFITISRRLEDKINKDHFNAKYQGLVFEKLTDPEDVKKYRGDHPNKNNLPKRKPLPIKVKDMSTGEEKIWDSVQEFANHHKVKKSAIAKSIYNTKTWRNFEIDYVGKKVDRDAIEKRKIEFYSNK